MVESLAYFKQKRVNISFQSKQKELAEKDLFCFKTETEDDNGDITKYFNKHYFIPTPSISLETSKIVSLENIPSSVIMGGRSLCSLSYSDANINQPPTSITYNKEDSRLNITLSESRKKHSYCYLYLNLRDVLYPYCPVTHLDPVFYTFALYSIKAREKLTEDFHVDVYKQFNEKPFSLMVLLFINTYIELCF